MQAHKVLVIDDEKPTLSMFQLFLQAYGYEVLLAENGLQGLEMFAAERPAIVFTDIKMPGMDGFEVLDRIKAQSPQTEVIVITGHGDTQLAVKALNHEATDFINKPIHRSALDAALHRAEERIHAAKADTTGIDSRQENDLQIIEITSHVSAASERELMDAYAGGKTGRKNKILLRFDQNATINGAGLGVLIQLLSECRRKHQAVAITGITGNFAQIFDMVGITQLAAIAADEQEARSYLNGECK